MSRPDEPPAVAFVRERLAGSRVVLWAQRYRTTAAVLGGLALTFKAYRWLLPWVYDIVLHPREGIASVRENWEMLAAGSAAVFVLGFLTVRFGLDWLARLEAVNRRLAEAHDADEKIIAPGPSWLERDDRPSRMHVPPRMG